MKMLPTRARFVLLSVLAACLPAAGEPETVHFPSADGRTELVGYLFKPAKDANRGAVVMLHGRSGPYKSTIKEDCKLVGLGVDSPCNASTLSGRHVQWGEFWAARGYLALHVDSFGPRGKGHGFGRFTHGSPDRADVNEITVRPWDAEGAYAFIARREDVAPDRVFLQGWSNGASTTLNVMHRQRAAFRAAIAFYPGCGPKALIDTRYQGVAPVSVLLGGADEETPPAACRRVIEEAKSKGVPIDFIEYEGAAHDFDNPLEARQAVEANRKAREASMRHAEAFFLSHPSRKPAP